MGAIPPGVSGNFGSFAIEGRPQAAERELPALDQGQTSWKIDVSRDYFRVTGVPLKEGRGFAATDTPGAPPVVVVNEALARKFFGGESALGHRVTNYTGDDWATIVGVVGDMHQNGLDREVYPRSFAVTSKWRTLRLTPRTNLLIRVANDPAALIPTLQRVVAAMDPDQPVFDVKTMEQRLDGFARVAPVRRGADRDVRADRHVPGFDRSVRSDVVPGDAEDFGDRDPAGAGRATRSSGAVNFARGFIAGFDRTCARRGRSAWFEPLSGNVALRGGDAGCGDVRVCGAGVIRCGGGGVLCAGSTRSSRRRSHSA